MLSNSETENSKAVKGTSPKLPSESESGTKPSNFEKDKGGKTILRKNTYHTTVISSRKSDTRVRPRTKIKDDFVSGRGRYEEKRGYRGSRGGGTSRKDRDETSYSRNIKFHDSLNKSKGYGSYTSNNEYETGRDYGSTNAASEDSRISTILRKLAREEDESKFSSLCNNLQEALSLPENTLYIRRSLDMILESLYELFRTGVTSHCKILAAKCLGHVGYNIEKEFRKYLDWVFNKFSGDSKETNRTLLMKSIYEYLMTLAREVMESTDVGDIFIITAEIILSLTGRYSTTFNDYFHDTVDIIVGWHIDVHQPPEVLRCATKCIQRLAPYWVRDMPFTLTLLQQFLEDAEGYKEELKSAASDETNYQKIKETVRKITSFIGVYISLFKGLGKEMDPEKNCNVTYAFLIDSMAKVMEIVITTLDPEVHDELVIAGNRCATLILGFLRSQAASVSESVYIYIDSLMGKSDLLSGSSVSSLFCFIAKVLVVLKDTTTPKFIELLLQPNSIVLRSRLSRELRTDALGVYLGLMKLEFPSFLHAYEYVTFDLEAILRSMESGYKPFTIAKDNPFSEIVYNTEPEKLLLFLLEPLSIVAHGKAGFNILNLRPSVFQILAMEIPRVIEPLKHPNTHHQSLCLLKLHCHKCDYFRAINGIVPDPSRLNLAEMSAVITVKRGFETSPRSYFLTIIINLLITNLKEDMEESAKVFVIEWAVNLLLLGRCHNNVIQETADVVELVKAITFAAMDTRKHVNIVAIDGLKELMLAYRGIWPHSVMKRFLELSVYFLNSVHPELRQSYHEFMDMLPCLVTTFSMNGIASEPTSALRVLLEKNYEEMCGNFTGEMSGFYFKQFIAYFLGGYFNRNLDWMVKMAVRCSPYNDPSYENGQALLGNLAAICEWADFESVRLCVESKLRTVMGKPLETLMGFEVMMRDIFKETVTRTVVAKEPVSGLRARLLVQFVEQLEKAIYNATEGTALAFPLPSKAVSSFFITNRVSCSEWIQRMRFILMVISINCGLASAAVRHGYSFLQNILLSKSSSQHMFEFDAALFHVGRALSDMGEKEAVEGLYVWAKEKSNVNFDILLPIIQQAGRRYEGAIAGYKTALENNLLTEEKLNGETDKLKTPILNISSLIADQITECYLAMNDWESLAEWKVQEHLLLKYDKDYISQKFNFIEPHHLKAVQLFDIGDYSAAKNLLQWNCPEEGFMDSKPTWDYCNVLYEMDFTLRNIAINMTDEPLTSLQVCCVESIKKCKTMAEKILEDCLKDAPSEVLNKAALIKYVAQSLSTRLNLIDSSVYGCEYKTWKRMIKSPVMEQVLWWGLALNNVHKNLKSNNNMKQFTLEVAKVSRKEGNYKFADKTLKEHLLLLRLGERQCPLSLEEVTDNYISTWGNDKKHWNMENSNALKEITKLLISTGNKKKGIELCSFTALGLLEKTGMDYRYTCSSMLRKLSTWITGDFESNTYLNKLLEFEGTKAIPPSIADLGNCSFKPEGGVTIEDSLSGRLLRLSVLTYPSMCKSWEKLAAWAYSCALNCLNKVHEGLTEEDKAVVQSIIPPGVEAENVFSILIGSSLNKDSEDIEGDAISSELVEQQLVNIGDLNETQISQLIQVWRKIHLQVYDHFRLSAFAYFKYIEISDHHQENNKIVTATLRLLRLIVKHSDEVQEVVESRLGSSPTSPWTAIVPQLFSRLNHRELYVRKRVAELLSRIGVDSPHLIIFPAVVGSHTGASTIKEMPTTKLFRVNAQYHHDPDDDDDDVDGDEVDDEDEENEDEEDANDDDVDVKNSNERAACLENCFLGILDTLSKKYGQEISQVKMLVSELRRITLLWDELWLGALTQHQTDINRRFLQLRTEVKLTDSNTQISQAMRDQLVAEKHRLILKPLLFVLEQLHAITSVTPETPHEKNFQEKFGKDIEEVLKKLKEPTDPRIPSEAWTAIKALQQKLYQGIASMTSRPHQPLLMKDISPQIAALKDSAIAMPGLKDPVTIQSIVNEVAILPTKTKPKKLIFNGSDGKQYTYLFKGLEDLHLDERIMQFLSIANSMLLEARLRARHYSVIPLGPRSGLISWVENVTPIFSLYKKWQQRESANNDNGLSAIMRPSELFYSKLGPILKEVGISSAESMHRNKWPLSALKKCLLELMQCTPDFLLSRELWCHSVNPSDWWQITKLYSSSLAVMSMIGYIIGLGDRHLDNVLVNLKTGEVVHIDYNVCFEKGKTLRVPEKVPFRLTPNLKAALGVTGVEGIYRLTCEHVLRVLKAGQETLLTLLEAFVYDPLIDWTPLNEGGYTGAVYGGGRELASETKQSKKDLEREVTCCMFRVRMTEGKHSWLDNKTLLLKELDEFLKTVESWQTENSMLKKIQQSLQERHSQLALLKEAEGQPNHSLYTLGMRYAKYMQVLNAKKSIQVALQTRIQDCDAQIMNYQAVLNALNSPEVSKWIGEVALRPKEDVCQVFDLIKEFLQNAGQNQMVQQCIQSEREVGDCCGQQTHFTAVLLDMLRQYYEVCRLYPSSFLRRHRSVLYKKWCQMLLEDMSQPTRDEVLKQMKEELSASDETMSRAAMFSAGLHGQHRELQVVLAKASERVANLPPHPGFDLESTRLDPQAVEAVVLTALCGLNKRFLTLEAAATSAGDCLLSLTSKEGNWFLDDMVVMGSTVLHLIQLIPSLNQENVNPNVSTAIRCLNASYTQYKALQDANSNYTNIILVEAMHGLQCEEPSVLEMVHRLESVVASAGLSLGDLLHQLELHLRFTVMGMESPHGSCLTLVEGLKIEFSRLIDSADLSAMPQGEMLLMGFDGLFRNVNLGRDALIQSLALLQTPPSWKTVDQIRDAKSHYTAPICEENTREVLEGMFFVKRLDAMLEVLRMLVDDAKGFRSETRMQLVPFELEVLCKPVRKYIADYVSYQLHGVFTHSLATFICLLLQENGLDVTGAVEQKDIGAQSKVPLDELCKMLVEQLSRSAVREASGMVSQREAAHRYSLIKALLDQTLHSAEGALVRAQLRLTAHYWLYEHYLVSQSTPPINRVIFLTEIRKNASALGLIQPKLNESLETQNSLIASAEQRLKWAAGANPALSEVMSAFESCVKSHRERVDKERALAQQIMSMANTVFLHEVLRTPTQEAVLSDNNMIRLVDDCEKTFGLIKNTPVVLSPVEDGLVSLMPPKKRLDADWISKAEEKISESIRNLKSELEPMQIRLFASEDCLKTRATGIRCVLARHHRVIADIKTLMKSMLKYEDAGLSGLENYLSRYKQYTERLSAFTKSVCNTNQINSSIVNMAHEETKAVIDQTEGIYSGMLKFSVSNDCSVKRPPVVRQGEASSKISSGTHGSQERNAYAMSVWRRVKFKLEGRDPDPSVRSTEKQQVDWTISEATNLDNLALLYEGWTPWV